MKIEKSVTAEEEFKTLQAELDGEYQPCGQTERALAEEIAICLWTL